MAFDMKNFLNAESRKDIKSDWKPVRVSIRKLRPAPDTKNFYHAEDKEIQDLAASIELIGLQQYPVVRPVEGTDEYEVIAGHKRRLALLRLLDEGKTEYETIPCKVETSDDIRDELILIFTNSTQRERTDYEKMMEIGRVRELLTEYQKSHELTGRKQKIIAGILGTSKTKVGTLDNINSHLIEPFKGEFASGKISTSTANEIAGLTPEAQTELFKTYQETGSLSAKSAKAIKEQAEDEQTEGQYNIYQYPEYPPENLKNEVRQYSEETGIGIEEAASIIFNRHQRGQEPPEEIELEETTPEPEKRQETAQEGPQENFMNQPETQVTYNMPTPDNTDRKSLVINGKINMHKEYNGMAVCYFTGAFISTGLFEPEFWVGLKYAGGNCGKPKESYIADYAEAKYTSTRTKAGYTVQSEKCEAVLAGTGLVVSRNSMKQTGFISYRELAELIDAMIYTKVIEFKTIESDLKSWAYRTVKDLASVSDYLTESEIILLQDLVMRCKERKGK